MNALAGFLPDAEFPDRGCFFGSGGSSGTQQTIQSTTPWSGQQPYLTTGFEQAQQNVLNRPQTYYPNSTVVPFSPQTEQALQAQEQRAVGGSPLNTAAQDQTLATLRGDYLNANPNLQGAIDAATRGLTRQYQTNVVPAIAGQFSGAGRYGSGLADASQRNAGQAYMQQVGDISSGMAYQNYNNERMNQLRASLFAPQLANQDYYDIGQLGQVGATREELGGRELQDQISRFNFAQQEPGARLANYMALVGGGQYGSNTTTTSPLYRNQLAGGLGGALAGTSLANQLGASPWLGAGAGALFGLL